MTDQILEALEIGLNSVICDQLSLRMLDDPYFKGEPPTQVDEDVRKIEAAIALYKSQMEDKS